MSNFKRSVQKLVDAGEMAGAVTAVWKNGRLVQNAAVGWRDIENRLPMTPDTIFRIASLTKPITSLAALMLYDDGKFALEDPITTWAPEFRDMTVLSHPDSPLSDVVAAQRPITFGDLLTHRSGLTYGGFHTGPIRKAIYDALGPDLDSPHAPEAWIARLAALPLIDQPGAAFHYGLSTDLLGLLMARLADKPLEKFLEERVFSPLGMEDTSFDPPPSERNRTARMYGFDEQGRLEYRPSHPATNPAFLAQRATSFVSGGAGLWSTVGDYLKFARLFVEDGKAGNARLIKPETLRRMTTNALTREQRAAARVVGMPVFRGHGFGLGVATVLDPQKASATHGKGGVGTVGWPGAFGGWWQADPSNGTVMVFLAHNAMDLERLDQGIGLGVYSAIADFHAAGAMEACD